ncbi:MAG TPA: DUF4846 domain-containing protein [Puia sp.]|nr:DUF4846 domain-containing protein [Puia sp.]
MKPNLRMTIILSIFCALSKPLFSQTNPYASICNIPLPEDYSRVETDKNSFAEWLRNLSLKKSKTVYLYNGVPKKNQSAQFAVIDISVGNKDLQQCADAVMRLGAEYLYAQKRFDEIIFQDNNHHAYKLGSITDRKHFDNYLDNVFAMCGTLSLEKQLKKIKAINELQPGDVLIQGGSPGHAMMVVDVAVNNSGKKIFLLAQSYMPAQDIHIVINPVNKKLSPWFELSDETIYTPEWVFGKGHFRTW